MSGGSPLRAAVEAKDLAPPPQPIVAAWCDARTTPRSAAVVLWSTLNVVFGTATFLILSSGGSPDVFALTVAGAVTMPGFLWLGGRLLPAALRLRPAQGYGAYLIGTLPLLHVGLLALGSGLQGSSVEVLWVDAILLALTVPQAAAEELLFRLVVPVLLVRWLGGRLTSLVAAAAGVLFVVAHAPSTPPAFAGHLAFGLLSIWVFLRCRTIWVPVVLHAVHNLLAHTVVVPAMWSGWSGFVVQWTAYGLAAWALLSGDTGRARTAEPAPTPADGAGSRWDGRPPTMRLAHFDALRALALLVIMIENLMFFLPASHQLTPQATHDRWVRASIGLLVEYRGLPLFCLLLGFGIAMAARDDPVRLHTVTRVRGAAFVVIGVLHGALLFSGDILTAYGVLLMVLHRPLARGRTPRVSALVVFVLGCGLLPLTMLAVPLPPTAEVSVLAASPTDAGVLRLEEWYAATVGVPLQLASLLLPTLVGHATGRAWLARDGRSLPTWLPAGLMLSSEALCLPHGLTLLHGWGADDSTLAAAAATWLAQLGGLLGALALWCQCLAAAEAARSRDTPPWLARPAKAGRNTLSGYLLASLLMALTLPAPLGLARLPLVWPVVLICLLWVGFAFGFGAGSPGPVERVLHHLTHARRGRDPAVPPSDPRGLGDASGAAPGDRPTHHREEEAP